MALLFTEGFDAYGTSNGQSVNANLLLARGWNGATTHNIRTGRFDGFALSSRFSTSLSTFNDSTDTTKVVGIAIQIKNLGATYDDAPIALYDGTTGQMSVKWDDTGHLQVYRGFLGTLLDTATDPLEVDKWYYLEFKTTINTTTGSYELKVDGETILSDSGIDTQESSNTYWNRFLIRTDESNATYFDDIYIVDTSGAQNTDFLNPVHIETLFPDADVTKQFTTSSGVDHYALVDDAPADGDTSYVEDSTSTNRDLFDFPALSTTVLTVFAVTSYINARVTDAGGVDMKYVNVSGATTTTSAANTISSVSDVVYSELYELDPNTSTAWTKTSVEAAQFGFEIA